MEVTVTGVLLTLGLLLFVQSSVGQAIDESSSSPDAMNSSLTTEGASSNVTLPTKDLSDTDDSDGNAVIIACIVIAAVIILAAVVAFLLLRKKRMSQMMDTEKKMQIQMTSARNAGVYQDLTVSVNEDKPPASPEHEKLKSAEEV